MAQRSTPENALDSATEVYQVRLFRYHPAIRWSYRVHEQILPALRRAGHPVHWTGIAVAHTGYLDPALRRQKNECNLHLLLLEALKPWSAQAEGANVASGTSAPLAGCLVPITGTAPGAAESHAPVADSFRLGEGAEADPEWGARTVGLLG